MSDDPTRSAPPANSEGPAAREGDHASPESTNASGGGNKLVWLIIGVLGCLGLLAICAVIGGIAFLLVGDSNEEASQTPTVEIAIQATETPTVVIEPTPEPTPTEEPTRTPEPAEEPTATPEPTPTPEPEPEMTPTPESEPEPEPEPAEPAIAFGEGTQVVGEDIQPGVYFANDVSDSCYWERLRGFSGELDDVISNAFSAERQIVAIEASDVAFSSSRCGEWERDAFPIREDPGADLEDGMYLVGDEIQPGAWRSEGSDGNCYWARLSGFGGELDDIITNSFGGIEDVVQIHPDDRGFESSYCGPWVRIGD
jgi:hypothetical protein